MSRYNLSSKLQTKLQETASIVAATAIAAGTFYVMQEYGLGQQAAEFMYPETNNAYQSAQSAQQAAKFFINGTSAAATGLATYALTKFDG